MCVDTKSNWYSNVLRLILGSHELRKFRLSVYQTDQGCVRDMIIIVLAGSGVSAWWCVWKPGCYFTFMWNHTGVLYYTSLRLSHSSNHFSIFIINNNFEPVLISDPMVHNNTLKWPGIVAATSLHIIVLNMWWWNSLSIIRSQDEISTIGWVNSCIHVNLSFQTRCKPAIGLINYSNIIVLLN